jgi:hypothetical protein
MDLTSETMDSIKELHAKVGAAAILHALSFCVETSLRKFDLTENEREIARESIKADLNKALETMKNLYDSKQSK